MAVINRRFRYLFLAEPRTASRAMRNALLTHTCSQEVGAHHDTLDDLRRKGVRGLSKCYTFSVVRNPADVLASMWVILGRKRLPFNDYLCKLYAECRNPDNLLFQHNRYTKTQLRYENLQTGLDTLLGGLGIPFVELPTVGVTHGKDPWLTYYGVQELDTILARCPELETAGYAEEIRVIRQILLDNLS
jgi:hypothetical protein